MEELVSKLIPQPDYQQLLIKISDTYHSGQVKATNAVNTQLLDTYWKIGQHIVEFEQGGNERAEYGKALISTLAKDLSLFHGKGFSRSNIVYMRLLYLRYPISQKPSHQLSWSHFVELLKIEDELERKFYENQTIAERWSVPQLKRQKNTALFQRLALSKNKSEILKLSAQGQKIAQPGDILKDPYVFEFLKIPEEQLPTEKELENHLCNNLQQFLLELGKGFTYVGRQYRMTINNNHYRVDLVFYHRILRCFVFIIYFTKLKKILFLSFLATGICSPVFSQNKFTDSLLRQLPLAIDDTSRVLIMGELSFHYRYINIDSALYFGEQALSLAEDIHFSRGEANALTHIGQAMREKGDLSKALELQIRARNIAKDNNYTTEYTTALRRIGLVYMDLRDFSKTLSYLHQALFQAERIQSKRGMAIEYMNLGMTHEYMKNVDSALFYVQKAFEGKDYIEDLYPEVLRVMGNIQTQKNNQSQAINYYRQGIEAGLILNDYRTISYICSDAAAMFKYFNQPDSSIAYAKKGLQYGKINSYKKGILFSSTILSEYYDSIDAKQALYYYKIAAAAKDSLFGAGNMQTIQSLVSKEESRQKEIEQAKAAYQNQLKLYGLFAGLGVFSIIAFIQYRNNRQKQQANKVLENTLVNLKSAQSQLIQSEKMASLGELTAGIAHEIQNPLNFVNNFSELSNELITEMNEEIDKGNTDEVKALSSDIKQNLEKIHHHGKRADSIVKGMLQHSQKGSGQKEPTDINALAEEYLSLAYHACLSGRQGFLAKDDTLNVSLITDFDQSIGKVNLVQQDISKVLLNVYNNAFYAVHEKMKSAPNGYEPQVSVSTRLVPASKNSLIHQSTNSLIISVKDNGTGIAENIKDKIFQPFFTTKPTGQGTGLGLSLSYDIVKAHGGELKVETREGEGSEFVIQLPID